MQQLTIREIQETVAARMHVPLIDILSSRRSRSVVQARHIAIWLARQTTLHSLPEIGRAFGDRDHTTVMHAIARIDTLMAEDDNFAWEVTTMLSNAVNNGDSGERRQYRLRLVEGRAAA